MYWPTPQDYNEAVQTPRLSFADKELQEGAAEVNALGLPRPMSGAFATVYRFGCKKRDWAVRCFLRNIEDQQKRYQALSRFICSDDLVYTVGFEYQQEGIKIHGQWYPMLKMEWVEGISLDEAVRRYLREPTRLAKLADRFQTMLLELADAGIAHGDLQHGNILIVDDDIRLVDYDGMFVPTLSAEQSNEIGHPNYQHPRRSQTHFGPYLDNFSGWVIYVALRCLSIDPSLWFKLLGGDECLLFKRSDFENPLCSKTFALLEHHESEEIRNLAQTLRRLLEMPLSAVPSLGNGGTIADNESSLAPLPKPDPAEVRIATSGPLPAWVKDSAEAALIYNPYSISPKRKLLVRPDFEAVLFRPNECFADEELRSGRLVADATEEGEHAYVFKLQCERRAVALKCFRQELPERERRYLAIQNDQDRWQSPFFVDFDYLTHGICVDGRWVAALKMSFVEGDRLDKFVDKCLQKGNKEIVNSLLQQFRKMLSTMRRLDIAHGNLTAENLLVTEQRQLKLVDYDGLFVPALRGEPRLELPDELYDHPSFAPVPFGAEMDNYAAWLIDSALMYSVIAVPMFRYGWERIIKAVKGDTDVGFWNMTLSEQWRVYHNKDIRERLLFMRKLNERHVQRVPQFAGK